MLKRLAITALIILAVCCSISYPVLRGRLLSWKLVRAVEENKVALVRSLLDKGIGANIKDRHGTPLLLVSVARGYREMTEMLLNKGADVDIKDDTRAISFKHKLIKGSGEISYGGATALQVAAGKGYNDIVRLLLDKGADADISTDVIKSNAVTKDGEQEVSAELGGTALNIALAVGKLETAKLLLPRTNNVNTVCMKMMPLHYAIMHGRADIVKALLEKGADVNAVGGDFDSTPLLLAIMSGLNDKCPDPEIVKLLLEYGADANIKDKLGFIPLQIACVHQRLEVMKLLLEYGANVNMKTKDGASLLHGTAYFGYSDIVELLIDYGIDVNAKDQRGQTALDKAIYRGHTDITNLIKLHGGKKGDELSEPGQ
ncbi:MAG: ankyrin repeat domain-containing protein [Sedimentisphaerales bacterium]|nr:ankyrin repeat domain-containing protein [Sedimentisphaerales bacterium]